MAEPLHFVRSGQHVRFTPGGFLRTWCHRSVVAVKYALNDNASPYDLVTFKDKRPRTPWCGRCVELMGRAQFQHADHPSRAASVEQGGER